MRKILQLSMLLLATISFGQTPIYQFNFDGNMANSGSSSEFTSWTAAGSGSVTYVNDRTGQPNRAINIPNALNFSANAIDVPGGNSSRTLSFWTKFVNDTDNKIYPVVGWGRNTSNSAFAFLRNGVQNTYYTWGQGNDYSIPQTNAQIQANNNGWVHIAMTHNGSTLTIYYNGVNAGNYNRALNTLDLVLYLNRYVNSTGGTGDAIQIDDLKIYDTALTTSEILLLYNPNASGNPPVITNVVNPTPTSTSAALTFNLNPGGSATTTSIVVTPVGGGIGSIFAGPSASGTTTQSLNYIITGLNPETCYTFRVEASNSASLVQSPTQMFCTLDANSNKTPIYHFEFNGNTQEKRDTSLAFGNPNSGFVGNNTAIRLNSNVQALNLPFLPQGSKPRTVTIKVFFESGALSQTNNVFSYGTASASQSFGYDQKTTTLATHYLWSNDTDFGSAMNFGTYYTVVFVYNGTDTRVYINGAQQGINSSTPDTVGTLFRLGRTTTGVGGFFNGRVDDLRVYNQALTASEVTTLSNSLSNNDFTANNLNYSIYPNPASDILSIEFTGAIKSVEFYSLQGQKVLSTTEKQINVSNLASGMYMVRVQDVDGAIATQKFTKQ